MRACEVEGLDEFIQELCIAVDLWIPVNTPNKLSLIKDTLLKCVRDWKAITGHSWCDYFTTDFRV